MIHLDLLIYFIITIHLLFLVQKCHQCHVIERQLFPESCLSFHSVMPNIMQVRKADSSALQTLPVRWVAFNNVRTFQKLGAVFSHANILLGDASFHYLDGSNGFMMYTYIKTWNCTLHTCVICIIHKVVFFSKIIVFSLCSGGGDSTD